MDIDSQNGTAMMMMTSGELGQQTTLLKKVQTLYNPKNLKTEPNTPTHHRLLYHLADEIDAFFPFVFLLFKDVNTCNT